MKITVIKGTSDEPGSPKESKTFEGSERKLIQGIANIIESKEFDNLQKKDFGVSFKFAPGQDVNEAKEFFNNIAQTVAKKDSFKNYTKTYFILPEGPTFSLSKDPDYGYILYYLKMPDDPVLLETGTGDKLPLPDKYNTKKVKNSIDSYNPMGAIGA